MNSNNSIDSSMLGWIMEDKNTHEHIDQVPWPLNKPCSGAPGNFEEHMFDLQDELIE